MTPRDESTVPASTSSTTTSSRSFVGTLLAIRVNVGQFNFACNAYLYRALSVIRQTQYWVYEELTGLFAPSKFAAYEGMSFPQYERSIRGENGTARFDGAAARKQIEKILRRSFVEDSGAAELLVTWGESLAGPGVFDRVDRSKWRFIRLGESRKYWTFSSNPRDYRLREAARDLVEDTRTVDAQDIRPGDLVLLWQTRDREGHRGVVGFGEVLTSPAVQSQAQQGEKYSVDPRFLAPMKRVRYRNLRTSNVPLWLGPEYPFLAELPVARATGGSIFTLSPGRWHEAFAAAGGDPATDRAGAGTLKKATEDVEVSGGQGFRSESSVRIAIEQFAVEAACHHYEAQGYIIEKRGKPYDLKCTRGEEVLYVEVKGTITAGDEVLLTPNEVAFAERHAEEMELFLLHSVQLVKSDGAVTCGGGSKEIQKPWAIEKSRLTPTGYIYTMRQPA